MAIKVNLPTIPILDALSLADQILIGSSASQGGRARLISVLALQAAIGPVGATAVINGDDGQKYSIVGVVVDNTVTLQAVQVVMGSTPGAVINADDGHQYRLVGVTENGEIVINAVLIL